MKPLLATDADLNKIQFPVIVSPKLDGIRCSIFDGIATTRSGKPIRNEHVQFKLGKNVLTGLDGELIVGNAYDHNAMQQTSSGVMSKDGFPDFTYWVFDFWNQPELPFKERMHILRNEIQAPWMVEHFPSIKLLHHQTVSNMQELLQFETACLEKGYEGVMIRDPDGIYKYGRSTVKEGILLKLKRFQDAEAEVIGVQQFMHNANELETDEHGYAKRSQHAENKVPVNMLGALLVRDCTTSIEFSIGTGYTHAQREEMWLNRASLAGKLVKYKSFSIGTVTAPRFPVFLGFRDTTDIS